MERFELGDRVCYKNIGAPSGLIVSFKKEENLIGVEYYWGNKVYWYEPDELMMTWVV